MFHCRQKIRPELVRSQRYYVFQSANNILPGFIFRSVGYNLRSVLHDFEMDAVAHFELWTTVGLFSPGPFYGQHRLGNSF
jgi:hypothetical protein